MANVGCQELLPFKEPMMLGFELCFDQMQDFHKLDGWVMFRLNIISRSILCNAYETCLMIKVG